VTVDAAGIETFSDATDAMPGDVVQYTAVFLNARRQAAPSSRATLPIPAGMNISRPAHPRR